GGERGNARGREVPAGRTARLEPRLHAGREAALHHQRHVERRLGHRRGVAQGDEVDQGRPLSLGRGGGSPLSFRARARRARLARYNLQLRSLRMARRRIRLLASSLTTLMVSGVLSSVLADGYIAGKAEALPDLEIGLGESGLEKKGGDYSIVTGKGYSLRIKS